MNHPYDYNGIRNIFTAQVVTVILLLAMMPLNMVTAGFDQGGTFSDVHLAFWSVCLVGWMFAGLCMIVGLTRMRAYSDWFYKAWRMMIFVILAGVTGAGCFVAAVMLGPMQMREGIAELQDSYRNYWLFGLLLSATAAIVAVMLILGILFNRLFLWGCAEIASENRRPVQAGVCRLLFPMGVMTLLGGIVALGFYYYQSLNSTVDSKIMASARFYLLLMGALWAATQLGVLVVTWRTWRTCAKSDEG